MDDAAVAAAALDFIAEHTSDVIVRTNRDGHVVYVSPSVRLFGYEPQALLGSPWMDLVHPDDQERLIVGSEALLRGELEPALARRRRLLRTDGEWAWLEGISQVVCNSAGEVVEIIHIFRDVTLLRKMEDKERELRAAQAALKESETRFRLIAESTCDIVLQSQVDGLLSYISPAVRAYGYEPEMLVGKPSDLVHPDDAARLDEIRRCALAGEILPAGFDRRIRCRSANRGWIWLEGNPQVIRDDEGHPVGLINVLRDVTARHAQEELFEAAFEHSGMGKCLIALDGTFLRANRQACQILARSEAELQKLRAGDLMHREDAHLDQKQREQLRAGQIESYQVEKRFRRADGVWIWCEARGAIVRQPDGAPKHYLVELRDLTAQRAAEAALRDSEERYRLIAENSSDLIVICNLAGEMTYLSPAGRLIGWTPEKLAGCSFADLMHPDDVARVARAFRKLLDEGESDRVRWRARDISSGGWVWLESGPSLLRDPATGEPTGFLDVLRDITLQVEQERALAEARAKAEAAAAAKAQFLANMSHEIRTPLTAVLGFTGLLREDPTVKGAAASYVERIAGAGNGLLAIVNDVLDFSKLEAGKFEVRPRPTDLAEVCEETLMMFASQAAAKGLELEFAAEPGLPKTAMLDGDRLRQMLINMIGNAIKFTEAGSVRLRVAQGDSGATAVIEVADTGPGLDAGAQALLFQRFSQVDVSTARQHGGTGLGLAICRGLAEAMGGVIGVASTPGEGSTFRLELPAPPVDASREGAAVGAAAIDGLRVYVVDDNATNRELVRRVLEVGGAQIAEACDGETALAELAHTPVDLVLMDLRMPGLDGRQTLARLRGMSGPNQDAPVLAFTADADVAEGGALIGFDGLVRKPIQPLTMYAAIAEATQRAPSGGPSARGRAHSAA